MKRIMGIAVLALVVATSNNLRAQEKGTLLRKLGLSNNPPAAPCGPCQAAAAAQDHLVPVAADGAFMLTSTAPAIIENVGPSTGAGTGGIVKINSKHLQFNYEVKDVGPSGLMGVEVWYSRDDGKTWEKAPTGVQRENPYYVDVTEEGIYGFTLVARNGFGGGKEPPAAGDPPQITVEVDTTKPVVFLTGVEPTSGGKALIVRWTATDKNLNRRPINLYYAEQTAGPWMSIAAGLENSGTHTWVMPPSTPSRFWVRIEAVDQATNVGTAESPSAILVDLAQPNVANVRVTTAEGK